MKKVAGLGFLVVGVFMGSLSCGAESVIIVATGEWPPFMSQLMRHYGVVNHIVTEAFAQEGVQAKYAFYPWARALFNIQRGVEHTSSAWYWNKERANTFYFSDPVFVEQQVFFYVKDHPFEWKSMEDLHGKRVGATIGYFYGDAFQQAEDAHLFHVERISTDEQNFKKLLAGRVDVVVASLFVGQELIRILFSPEEIAHVTYHPQPVHEGPLFLIFKKDAKGQEWMALFNRGLAKLKGNGQWDQILQNALKGEEIKEQR